MSFGQKMLEKYGWAQGQGLGPEGQGMQKAIPLVASKADSKGIGSGSHSFVNWWDDLYGKCLDSVQPKVAEQPTVKDVLKRKEKRKRREREKEERKRKGSENDK
jgi:hypothetical protein